jgi:hypothetical protein
LNPVFEEPQDFESCDICERTILRGERVTEYVTPDGGRQRVCALCHGRAEAAGWIPASRANALAQWPPPSRGRGLALRERISRAAARVRPPRPSEPPADVASSQPPSEEPVPAPATAAGEAAQQARPGSSNGHGEAPAPPATTRSGPAAKAPASRSKRASGERKAAPKRAATPRRETPERRLRRAIDTFNASEESRVVAGLVRSLGQPQATVRNLSARPPRVTITVAWELSWYRWEIDLDGDQASVREVDKGKEVDELDADDRAWNASIGEDGRIGLKAAARRVASSRGSKASRRSASNDE